MKPSIFVITGAAGGIGKHLAATLRARGATVVATDLQASDGIRQLDVTKPDEWARLLDDVVRLHGRIDVLLNVAGYLKPGWAHEMPAVEVDRHFDVNVKGVVFGTQAAALRMVARGSGHVVNIASLAALMPVPGLALYSASKYAVRAFSIASDRELRPKGVAVSVVCPDAVRTPMLDLQKDYPQAEMTFSGPRVLTVDDVTRVILERVLQTQPTEVFIPAWRGWAARVGDVFPDFAAMLTPLLKKMGRRHQRTYAKELTKE
ncbi:MAG: SDR family NAD(P)-dependent oxidoreductase [Deltaproteobacteria bacterium]|nr:SDR family NAD(P)-dependent oxidoreductase [Deltaproteobacteria bacterium]